MRRTELGGHVCIVCNGLCRNSARDWCGENVSAEDEKRNGRHFTVVVIMTMGRKTWLRSIPASARGP